jgi:hypothetical protein
MAPVTAISVPSSPKSLQRTVDGCGRGWCCGGSLSGISDRISANVCRLADDLRADLDQLFAQAGQRPRLRRLRHRQRPHEVAEVIRGRMELEADGVGGEGADLGPAAQNFAEGGKRPVVLGSPRIWQAVSWRGPLCGGHSCSSLVFCFLVGGLGSRFQRGLRASASIMERRPSAELRIQLIRHSLAFSPVTTCSPKGGSPLTRSHRGSR